MNFGLPPKSMNMILKSLGKWDEIERASIFGSRAMGNFKNGSDVDLALFGSKITHQTLLGLGTLLNEELPLPYHFDLVHYESLDNPALKHHIDTAGKLFYVKD
ncbi:MAG: nucleotidyltransferase domain-containing protein [Firmicutes bacterium]|nr:nucleotidyltransferase domain-containing protein [Bacillota bacterium]